MGMIKITSSLRLPLLAMLLSATYTSKFVWPNTVPTAQSDNGPSKQTVHSMVPDSCCAEYGLTPELHTAGLSPTRTSDSATVHVAAIWDRMRSGFVLPAVNPDKIRTYIDEYTMLPRLTELTLRRGEPYLHHILNQIEQDGMPAELALLPVIESAFDPFVTSPAGAAGIWQFMPRTAIEVGLDLDWWYDGRRDIIASTDAALYYLRQLNKRFKGDWFLTLAAYNAGSARVRKAMRRNREAGKPVDYWHLPLPDETRAYVPKLLALKAIVENPQDYNVSLPRLPDTRYFSTLRVKGLLELKVAARLAGIPLEELQRLNPGYDRSITAPGKVHTLLVPRSVGTELRERIASLPAERRVQSIRHQIQWGESLSSIAEQYRTTVPELRKANRLKDSKIIAGDTLIVPLSDTEQGIVDATLSAQL